MQFKILRFTTQHNVLVIDIKTKEHGSKTKSFDTIWLESMVFDEHIHNITYGTREKYRKPSCNI